MNTKKYFYLELFEEAEAVNFYTIRFEGDIDMEFEKFLKAHDKEEFSEDLNTIIAWIDKIGETGALERHFRPEGKMSDGVEDK